MNQLDGKRNSSLQKCLAWQRPREGTKDLVRVTGVEPACSCEHRNLNPARLPIPPHPQRIEPIGWNHRLERRDIYSPFASACKGAGSAPTPRFEMPGPLAIFGKIGKVGRSRVLSLGPKTPKAPALGKVLSIQLSERTARYLPSLFFLGCLGCFATTFLSWAFCKAS